MGSGQSARKLTVINEEEVDVIKVSNAVVQRLTQQANEGISETAHEVRATMSGQSAITNKVVSPQGGDISNSGQPTNYYPQITLSALDMQQQKEKELLTQDQYWQKRLKNLEKQHTKINEIMDEEYKKAVEQLYADGPQVNLQDSVQPCLNTSEKVLKCYQEYPKEILKCSNLVEEFSNCVDQRRARVIEARC